MISLEKAQNLARKYKRTGDSHVLSTYFLFMDSAFNAAYLQSTRINEDRNNIDLARLFPDIHFFLISVANIRKLLFKIKNLLREDSEFVDIWKKYDSDLEKLNFFRDHLEHIIDGRLEGKGKKGPLKAPAMLGNLFVDDYDFGGERFNLKKAFVTIKSLFDDLEYWAKKQ